MFRIRNIGSETRIWTSSEYSVESALHVYMENRSAGVWYGNYIGKGNYFSVRCVKDTAPADHN